MSMITRMLRRTPAPDGTGPTPRRALLGRVATVVACVVVLLALTLPNRAGHLSAAGFLRVPVEAIIAVALLVVLTGRARRIAAVSLGVLFGLLAIVKTIDIGFYTFLDRPFDPLSDGWFLKAGYDYLAAAGGHGAAVGAVAGAVLLAVAVLLLLVWAVRRVSRVVAAHRSGAARCAGALGVVWVLCAVAGFPGEGGEPVAARDSYDHLRQLQAGLADRAAFASQEEADAFRDVPADRLLTGLRGKDVVIAFVESYGRVAVEDPQIAPGVTAALADGDRRLASAGYAARSAFLTSSTAGGGSWLAHATLLSGLWINSQARHDELMTTDRMTLTGAFQKAGWRTVAVMPAVNKGWPEASFFHNDTVYDQNALGYRGPIYSFATMPDQYTLSAFERTEHAKAGHLPLMAEIVLVSSHAPWAPVPTMMDWSKVGDGSGFAKADGAGDPPEITLRQDPKVVRAAYGKAVTYSLQALISYVETYGDDNLVLVFLGDHQPAPTVTGEGASRDVPITIVARDRAVLDRVSGWGWTDGLKPDPGAPVWRMDEFRDRFLTAFGPR